VLTATRAKQRPSGFRVHHHAGRSQRHLWGAAQGLLRADRHRAPGRASALRPD
jgi:hypothetical protein